MAENGGVRWEDNRVQNIKGGERFEASGMEVAGIEQKWDEMGE